MRSTEPARSDDHWERWYRDNIPIAERLYIEYTDQQQGVADMPKRIAPDREELERDLHAAGVSPEEIDSGARALLAQARGHQLAEARKQLGLAQRDIAARMGVSVARISQIEHGELASFDMIARFVEALGRRPTDL
jgi:ribosome-binding protein aMBF1 (putative translation factor)